MDGEAPRLFHPPPSSSPLLTDLSMLQQVIQEREVRGGDDLSWRFGRKRGEGKGNEGSGVRQLDAAVNRGGEAETCILPRDAALFPTLWPSLPPFPFFLLFLVLYQWVGRTKKKNGI